MIVLKPFFVVLMLMVLISLSYIATSSYLGATLLHTNSRFPEWSAPQTDKVAETRITRPSALLRQERVISFGANTASLSPEMKTKLNSLSDLFHARGHAQGVHVVGFADPSDTISANQTLSKKRAETVAHYIIANARGNINSNIIDMRWRGAGSSPANCSDSENLSGDCLRKERRVEVEVDYIPDQEASR